MAQELKYLYNEEYILLLCDKLSQNFPSFNSQSFTQQVFDNNWDTLELKERMRHISTSLYHHLPKTYEKSIDILKKTFSQMNYAYNLENIIFQDYVEVYGLEEIEVSFHALEHFTINSTSEFAIRKFILKYPKESMLVIKKWVQSENEHIRRLSTEGIRPRLPWAIALKKFQNDPTEVLEILELLKDDTSEYVQKSIANNLNDISKDHPQKIKQLTKNWLKENPQRVKMLKHACRTLLKNGDTECLKLFGYSSPSSIKLSNFFYTNNVTPSQDLKFNFQLSSAGALGKLRVEFAIKFLRKNKTYNKKVFKVTEGEYEQSIKEFSKSYSFKPITTRNYYKGKHYLIVIVNGIAFTQVEFVLN